MIRFIFQGEMNKIMRPEKIGADMRAFQQANMKMEMTDEMSMLTDRFRKIHQLIAFAPF